MRWVRHVECLWEKRNAYSTLMGICEGMRPLKRHGTIILKWIFKKKYVKLWIGIVCLSIGTTGALLLAFGFHQLQGIA
jgi:hypothetical protein